MTALSMQIAKEAFIPATKRELSHWSGNSNIDPNISCIGRVSELLREPSSFNQISARLASSKNTPKG